MSGARARELRVTTASAHTATIIISATPVTRAAHEGNAEEEDAAADDLPRVLGCIGRSSAASHAMGAPSAAPYPPARLRSDVASRRSDFFMMGSPATSGLLRPLLEPATGSVTETCHPLVGSPRSEATVPSSSPRPTRADLRSWLPRSSTRRRFAADSIAAFFLRYSLKPPMSFVARPLFRVPVRTAPKPV